MLANFLQHRRNTAAGTENRGRAPKKRDEFPSPHGFAPAKDYIGSRNEYHIFGSRIVPFVTPKRRASMFAMGQKQTFGHWVRSVDIDNS
jgi:hypothetical protein